MRVARKADLTAGQMAEMMARLRVDATVEWSVTSSADKWDWPKVGKSAILRAGCWVAP
jgi:hypothetical protein